MKKYILRGNVRVKTPYNKSYKWLLADTPIHLASDVEPLLRQLAKGVIIGPADIDTQELAQRLLKELGHE